MEKRIKIRHTDGREVEGVKCIGLNDMLWGFSWEKEGLVYLQSYGWYEVKEPKYVDVTDECEVLQNGDMLLVVNGDLVELPDGHSFRKKQWFDLPENLLFEIYHMTAKGFVDYIQRFKKYCIIVEKEE